jgi:hypothetical protein
LDRKKQLGGQPEDNAVTGIIGRLKAGRQWLKNRNLSKAGSDVFDVTWGSSDQIKLEPPKIVSRNPTKRQVPQGLVFCIDWFSSFR